LPNSVWTSLQDPANRAVLGWIGSGVVVVVGAVWAAFKFFISKEKPKAESMPTIAASNGGVAAGRDIRDAKINTSSTKR
jgi:hypothetical protein